MDQETEINELSNSLGAVAQALTFSQTFNLAQVSQTDTMILNLRYSLISNNRNLLNHAYVEHGVIQTLIDQPVDDALRSGVEIKSNQIDSDDLDLLLNFMERTELLPKIAQATKWARLFGGGAVIVLTDQDYSTPLDLEKINKNTMLDFRPADMWELYHTQSAQNGWLDLDLIEHFDYYGKKIHRSRVFTIKGKEPPSQLRPILRGWGMSEVEKAVRSINAYLKNQQVTFDLLDEAKIDVYKIKGFNSSLLSQNGSAQISNRVALSNRIKNYLNAIVMDVDDDYEQKNQTFGGLSDILTQIRQTLAADLKMPMTKLFGMSATGFNSGEDDIENYNSMVEGEVRAKIKFVILDLLQICCQKVLGVRPPDLKIEFPPLRIMGADQVEEIKSKQFDRIIAAYDRGLLENASEAKQAINKGTLLPIEINESDEVNLPDGYESFTDTNL